MKKPTLKGWLAILGALVALVLTLVAALADRNLSKAEADDLTAKTGALVEAIQQATDDTAPVEDTTTVDASNQPKAQP